MITKTDYAAEITKIKNGYFTNAALDARHKDLVQKTTFESELKKVDDNASANSSNVLLYERKLKQKEDTINDLERDTCYFRGKNYFGDDGMQNYFVFQPMYKYCKRVIDSTDKTVYVHYWQSKGLSDGKINAPNTSSSNNQEPILQYGGTGIRLKFKGDLLRQNKVTYNHGKIVNIYIVYEISSTFTSQRSFTLKYSLFGAVKITKHADISKYRYSGYRIGFDSKGSFLHADGTYGVNVIIFGADLSSSTHVNNSVNNILVLGKDFIQGINSTKIYAEKMYSAYFTVYGKKNCLSLHYNGDNSYLFVNNRQIIKFKPKDSEIVLYPLCLAGISKDFSSSNATGLYGYVYDFSADYKAIANDKIYGIKVFNEKEQYKMIFGFIKKFGFIICFFAAMTFFNFNLSNVFQ